MSLSSKLVLGFLVVAVISAIIGTVGIVSLRSVNDKVKLLTEDILASYIPLVTMAEDSQRLRVNIEDVLLETNKEKKRGYVENIGKITKALNEAADEYKRLITTESGRDVFQQWQQAQNGFVEKEKEILALDAEGKGKQALDLFQGEAHRAAVEAQEALNNLSEHKKKHGGDVAEDAYHAGNVAQTSMIAAILIGFLVSLGLGIVLSRSITKSLQEVATALDEGADQVASGSSQVAQSSQQLAEGATEAASSLEETSSSMEEMASMTRQNSDNATRANKLMDETKTLIQRGSDAVEGTLRSMVEMNDSAEKVSKIIKTIEEIAFQTNLLALNAAVEAARAGEHGRGFAVVAEEVRNLAQRSAAAAKDTAALIEENARRAGSGIQVSEEAGKALKDIVGGSAKVANLISEIAAASQEQSRGIGEINGAVGQMDKVTQRVTANAEELSSASEEMSSQAAVLRDMVQRLVKIVEGSETELVKRQATTHKAAVRPAAPAQAAWKPAAAAPRGGNGGNGGDNRGVTTKVHELALAHARHAKSGEDVIPLGKDDLKDF